MTNKRVPKKLPPIIDKRRAYFVTIDSHTGKWKIALVTENEPGYNDVDPETDIGKPFDDEITATEVCDLLNVRLGLDKRDVANIITSSIRISDVRIENEDGSTIRRRPQRFQRTRTSLPSMNL